jgi:transposase InsO family protein
MQNRNVNLSLSDSELIALIRAIITEKPTYGYRRVCTILNHRLSHNYSVNHKRIYRIMKQYNLLHMPYGKKPIRVHDGKIVTIRSNLRWCSDCFTITCDNGDRVQVSFALDCCDREIMGYTATVIGGVDGEMICDLIANCVAYRFGDSCKLPNSIQWLTDNGPCYTARKTVNFARQMGFEVCTTRPYSPESNGMAEAFVKTFKRDYVWVNDLPDANTVISRLSVWFNDYNEYAPHKGLKMLSPRQFLRKVG